MYAVDAVPSRLAMAKALGAEVVTVDFKNENVTTVIHEAVPQGLDGKLAHSSLCLRHQLNMTVCIDSTTFHEPKTLLHKVEKALMLETDVSETPNEVRQPFIH